MLHALTSSNQLLHALHTWLFFCKKPLLFKNRFFETSMFSGVYIILFLYATDGTFKVMASNKHDAQNRYTALEEKLEDQKKQYVVINIIF